MDGEEELYTIKQLADTSGPTGLIGYNVPVHTSLPPQVEGQLRCFLCLCISQIKWVVHQHPARTVIHVTWWGETGSGTIFRPFDASREDNDNIKTTARYPIRSGPKQFTSYLNDMNVLLLEILDEDSLEIVGYAEVDHIATLTTYNPLKSIYAVSSLEDKKIAELHVCVTLEPVMESYDSSGFLPTNDINDAQTFQPTKPDMLSERISATHSIKGFSTQNMSVPSSVYSLQKEAPMSQQRTCNIPQSDTTVSITTGGNVVLMQNGFSGNELEGMQSSKNSNSSDLISILLEKGNKLRETMVLSMADELPSKQHKQNFENSEMSLPMSRSSSCGSLLREILNTDDCPATNISENSAEDRVINLVLGPNHEEELIVNNPDDSSVSSLELNGSDISDPLHEAEILQDLFYTNQLDKELLPGRKTKSHSLSSLEDPDNQKLSSQKLSLPDNCENVTPEKATKSTTQWKSKVLNKPKSPSLAQKSLSTISKMTEKSKTSPKPKLLSRPKSPSVRSKLPKSKSSLHTMDSPRSKMIAKHETSPKVRRSSQSFTRKKKLKTKQRHSGSCTANTGDASDTDSVSTYYSESSRVSFDMVPSDVEEAGRDDDSDSKMIDGLSIERLTLLGRAKVARVTVDALNLLSPTSDAKPERKSAASNKSLGRPPKPKLLPQKSNSYFLEYQFPVIAAARDKYAPNTMATEVTRITAKQVKEDTVHFNHHSVFPILFDGKSIENWWKSAINFKIYSRTSDQKSPSLIGSCQLPLKSILKAENLCLIKNLLVCKPGKQSRSTRSRNNSSLQIGYLKISVDIGSDTANFASALSRTKLAELNGTSQIIPIASTSSKQNTLRKPTEQHSTEIEKLSSQDADTSVNTADLLSVDSQEFCHSNHKFESKLSLPIYSDKHKSTAFQNIATVHQTPFNSYQNTEDLEPLALHSLLIINEGRKINTLPQNALHDVQDPNILQGQSQSNVRNIYLHCRMFWCDQSVSSSVCWGTNDPQFNFVQVSPVLINPNLLERMRNNYLIIEVWDKKTTTPNDELVGIVKLSLHQFYLSLRNKRITSALLKAQYPIIAHDYFVPIVDPLSNCQHGQLKVLLAIGSVEQVSTLQRVTLEHYMSVTIGKEKTRNVDTIGLGSISKTNLEEFVEYLFEIVVEDISHMPQFEGIIWGETDCFIQYLFPFQTRSHFSEKAADIGQQATLKTFRTATTPCIPDPSFQSITKHKFNLYAAIPVQTQLLNAFVDTEGNITEVSFELWGRFYHPNVRDHILAKATLPLVKLFAMISMYKKDPLLQSFSLPLISDKAATSDLQNQKTGNLNITITYKSQVKQSSNLPKSQSNSSSVYISVGLLQICGLQAAAEYCARDDQSMQYPSEVGVNTYIKAKLSFIHDRVCTTRTFARNFCPEVGQFFEFHCPLSNKDSCSLAEILETAELFIEFWHQVPAELEPSSHLTTFEDVLLGVTKVPLIGLLTKRTGIQGWLPINRSSSGTFLGKLDSHFTNQLEYVMGGIEVKINFTHASDLERLLLTADNAGWNLPEKYLLTENFEDFEDGMSLKVTINIDEVNISKNCLFSEQTSNFMSQCYLKYIFHDKGPFVSKPLPFRIKGKNFLFAKDSHQNSFYLPLTAPLIWYLREEKVEIQLWCGSDSGIGHHFHKKIDYSRDKLIGSAWIPLASLCHGQKKNVPRISGIYPMFKDGLPNLHGMHLRAHISLHFQKVQDEQLTPEESSVLDSDWNDSFLAPDSADFINIFHVHISIEQAMHLTHIVDKSTGKLCQPSAYVSFTTAHKNKMASTNVIFDNDCPVWEYDLDTVLSSELLYEENKNLVFKVWHKPENVPREPDKSSDQVIGFVSVDLAPLVSGLKQLCGWYNIIDFSGRCRGQVKLSVTPLESIVHHWNQLKSHINTIETNKSGSLQKSVSHFSEHYQNVKLHHELLQSQQQSQQHDDDGHAANTKFSSKPITKKVAYFSDSSSRSQLMSKLQQQMVELDELNAYLKTKLDPFSLSTEREPDIYPISQGIGFSTLKEENNTKNDQKSPVTPILAKHTQTSNVSKGLYAEQFSEVSDKYLADDLNNVIAESPAAVSEEICDEKKDESLSSDQMQNISLHYDTVNGSDYLFTAHPIGQLSSTTVPLPELNNNYADLTVFDSEVVQILTEQEGVENPAQTEASFQEHQQFNLDNNKENYCQDFRIHSGELSTERIHVSSEEWEDDIDGGDFEMEDYNEDEENVLIPRIMNDIHYTSDQPQNWANEEQGNETNSTKRELLGNIIHNPTENKPPDGLRIMPKSQVVLSDNSVDSLCDTLEIPADHDIFQTSSEKFHIAKSPPETGKHIIFEEEFHFDTEPTILYSPPDNVPVKQNAEAMIDEALSANHSRFQEDRLSPDAFVIKSSYPNANQTLFKSNNDTNNAVLINKKEPEFSTKENFQNKPATAKSSNQHPVNKILHTNFFLPLADLEQSMRAVKLSTAIKTYKSVMDTLPYERDATHNQKLPEKAFKETKVPVKYTSLPTNEESQRIARIFSMKFS